MTKQWVSRTECPSCVERGSEHYYQNLWVDSEGGTYCFVCQTHHNLIEHRKTLDALAESDEKGGLRPMIDGKYAPLAKRKITEEVCRRGDTKVGEYNGRPCIIFDYGDSQKLKFVDGQQPPYITTGDSKGCNRLFLMDRNNPDVCRSVVVTEGEIDALTILQMDKLGAYVPVSLPKGVAGARKCIEANLDYLLGFKEVILAFDMDEAGQKGIKDALEVFTSGKVRVVKWTRKDANEMLMEGEQEAIKKCIWNAKVHREDDIVGTDFDEANELDPPCFSWPYPSLDRALLGVPPSGLTTLVGAQGSGKSTLAYDLIYKCLKDNRNVGIFSTEWSRKVIGRRLYTRETGEMWFRKNYDTKQLTPIPEEHRETFNSLLRPLSFYRNVGCLDAERLKTQIRTMYHRNKCHLILIDNLSDIASSMGRDERIGLDKLMSDLKAMCLEMQPLSVILIVHTSQAKRSGERDRSFEQGRPVTIADIRSSGSMANSSKAVVAVNRDISQQGQSTLAILKDNESGSSGMTFPMVYVETHDTLQEGSLEV